MGMVVPMSPMRSSEARDGATTPPSPVMLAIAAAHMHEQGRLFERHVIDSRDQNIVDPTSLTRDVNELNPDDISGYKQTEKTYGFKEGQ